ncbi:MAG: sensor histidine kinase [Acidimicrobiia bacterium]
MGDGRWRRAFRGGNGTRRERERLRAEADRAHVLAESNQLRSALLQAVSHDLRTPLALIKASVSSLCQPDIEWPAEERAEFLATISRETDRLTTLVENLLAMSQLQAGVLQATLRPVGLEEVVPAALANLGSRAGGIESGTTETLPSVLADASLLERALTNVLDNALHWSPPGAGVRLEAEAFGPHVDLRVVDHGPGISRQSQDLVFQPFQRLGDTQTESGVGLGLAVARGFVQAMGGTIDLHDTAGGGTTVVLSLHAAPAGSRTPG